PVPRRESIWGRARPIRAPIARGEYVASHPSGLTEYGRTRGSEQLEVTGRVTVLGVRARDLRQVVCRVRVLCRPADAAIARCDDRSVRSDRITGTRARAAHTVHVLLRARVLGRPRQATVAALEDRPASAHGHAELASRRT